MTYCQQKKKQHHFNNKNNFDMSKIATYNMIQQKKTIL